MGSSTIVDNTPTMAEDKKNPLKSIIKNIKCKLGIKKDKHVDKNECQEQETKDNNKEIQNGQVILENVLENFKKLEIEHKKRTEKKKEDEELKNFSFKAVADNEHENFTYKVVEEDRGRTESIQSQSSQDSGFSEKDAADKSDEIAKEDDEVIKAKETTQVEVARTEEEVLESLQNLKIEEDGKKKKLQTVPVPRGPIRNKTGSLGESFHPYLDTEINHTVNRQTFSGGQVIVANRTQDFVELQVSHQTNPCSDELQIFTEDLALRGVQFDGPNYGLDIVQEFLDEHKGQVQEASTAETEDILREFLSDPLCSEHFDTITELVEKHIEEHNPIEELENETTNYFNYEKIETLDSALGLQEDQFYTNIYPTPPSAESAHSPSNNELYGNFLTPPRSETVPSPMSDTTLYQNSSDCVMSPNSDCEKYQEIPYYEELPTLPDDIAENTCSKARERNPSTSSMTMKNFKDLQKELAARFSKKQCCQLTRKPCKELFLAHIKKLKAEDRRNMCLKVSQMDLKTTYGVLHHVLLGLSRGDADEDLHMSLFALLCEKTLGTKPQLFVEQFGLSLLEAAALRCPERPLLVRYVVQCIRTALQQNPALGEGKDFLFKEVDGLGDTLVGALARAGDACAGVLSELLRADRYQRPLFNLQHVNAEGYSALHVACREHSAASSRLHTAHVLLEHGGADIWRGDVKGGDSAVHMAVNSSTCDLSLVLLLFKHLDRKEWKRLAHQPNRSSVTPLDYARCAAKSTTRTTYPTEVLEFLKKCR